MQTGILSSPLVAKKATGLQAECRRKNVKDSTANTKSRNNAAHRFVLNLSFSVSRATRMMTLTNTSQLPQLRMQDYASYLAFANETPTKMAQLTTPIQVSIECGCQQCWSQYLFLIKNLLRLLIGREHSLKPDELLVDAVEELDDLLGVPDELSLKLRDAIVSLGDVCDQIRQRVRPDCNFLLMLLGHGSLSAFGVKRSILFRFSSDSWREGFGIHL